MKKVFRLVAAGALATALPFAASAAVATGTITVNATVAGHCTVGSPTINFGSVNAGSAAANTTTQLVVTCNKGVTITSLLLNDGANPNAGVKEMAFGAERLSYKIEVPNNAALSTCPVAGTGTEWNATGAPLNTDVAALFTASGGPKNIVLCASIPAGQYPAAGGYSDSVTATLTYN